VFSTVHDGAMAVGCSVDPAAMKDQPISTGLDEFEFVSHLNTAESSIATATFSGYLSNAAFAEDSTAVTFEQLELLITTSSAIAEGPRFALYVRPS